MYRKRKAPDYSILLESSHELQTCDWPRNVGCEGLAEVAAPAPSTSSSGSSGSSSRVPESRSRYNPPPPPPPAQPAAVVTSRGQPKQLHHTQQEIIKVRATWKQKYLTLTVPNLVAAKTATAALRRCGGISSNSRGDRER